MKCNATANKKNLITGDPLPEKFCYQLRYPDYDPETILTYESEGVEQCPFYMKKLEPTEIQIGSD